MQELVHVIPLGFEIERATAPFESGARVAHRAILLSIVEPRQIPASMHREQQHYIAAVKRRLVRRGIRVQVLDVDTFDLDALMSALSRVLKSERTQGNLVYVNMSAAGRLQAVAASLAAMAHGGELYFVHADSYPETKSLQRKHGMSRCSGRFLPIQSLPVEMPSEKSRVLLADLAKRPAGSSISTKEAIAVLQRAGFEGFSTLDSGSSRLQKTNSLMKLNKQVLERLATAGHIKQERVGRNKRIQITESGRYLASLSGLL